MKLEIIYLFDEEYINLKSIKEGETLMIKRIEGKIESQEIKYTPLKSDLIPLGKDELFDFIQWFRNRPEDMKDLRTKTDFLRDLGLAISCEFNLYRKDK